jgi:two-component system sensor histidine kinase CreC
MDGEDIVGSLTVANPNQSVQPFIDLAMLKIKTTSFWLIVISIVIGAVFSFGLTRSIRKLVEYADRIAQGRKAQVPKMGEVELSKLADAIENMRQQLEGKAYVERYVHALTHELKSPVSAIKGAAELLSPTMDASDFQRFQSNILQETDRIDVLINRLLALANLEAQDGLETSEPVSLNRLLDSVVEAKCPVSQASGVSITLQIDETAKDAWVVGDAFLLAQVFDNLLQNALEFSPSDGTIVIEVSRSDGQHWSVRIIDQGPGIPEYALERVFERFYSLVRPNTNQKSTGLGLCFVKEIVALHHGQVELTNLSLAEGNAQSGCEAQVILPRSPS